MKKSFTAFEGFKHAVLIEQFLRYAVVGGIASVADVSLYYVAAGIFDANHLLANTLSFSVGLLVNYFLSREWVFNYSRHRFGRDFVLFAVIGVIGLGISSLILFLLVDMGILSGLLYFAGDDFIKLAAKLIAVLTVLFWNFFARKKIVFQKEEY